MVRVTTTPPAALIRITNKHALYYEASNKYRPDVYNQMFRLNLRIWRA